MDFRDRQHQTASCVNARLDCRAVVSHFGGKSALCRTLKEHGVELSVKAIEKWRSRQNIPTAQLVTLAAIAKARGIRFDIYDFIKMAE